MFKEYFKIAKDAFEFVRNLPTEDISRPLNGGLPDLPADAVGLWYPKPGGAVVAERAAQVKTVPAKKP
jgi:hypothetical protein